MQQILLGLAAVLEILLRLYFYVVIASVIVSLVNADPWNFLVQFIRRLTEPVYYAIRRRMPFVVAGGFDLSPMVVILLIIFAQYALVANLRMLAYKLP